MTAPRTPRRLQRRRLRGWRKPPGAVIVDRTSVYGNPFTVAAMAAAGHTAPAAAAVARYEAWLDGDPAYPDVLSAGRRSFDRRIVRARMDQLSGRDLLCPCDTGSPCHGDILLDRANRPASESTSR